MRLQVQEYSIDLSQEGAVMEMYDEHVKGYHRERNGCFLDKKLSALGLRRMSTVSDGDCGYHAILSFVQGARIYGTVVGTVADLRQSLHHFL